MTRSDTLQKTAISRLESALSISSDNVMPVQMASGQGDNATIDTDDLDPRVSVGASLDSTERNSLIEESSGTVRVIVDGTRSYVRKNGTLGLTELQSDVIDELTKHESGWQNPSLDSEEEVAWESNINRYVGVVQVGVDDWGLHPHY